MVSRASGLIAKYSYGEYLCHATCIWFALEYLGNIPAAARWTVFIGLLVGVPVLAFHILEAPMIALGGRLAEKWFQGTTSPAPTLIAVPTGRTALRQAKGVMQSYPGGNAARF